MTDEFWTPEDAAEFAQAEQDDAAASQAAEDQFPDGWTEVGATEEGFTLLGDLHGGGTRNEGLQNLSDMTLGPARIFTQSVSSPVFEAIDRASADRTPLLETTRSTERSWIKIDKALADWRERASTEQILTVETKLEPGGYDTLIELLQGTADAMQQFTQAARSVALMGTGYRRHASPGKRRSGETRAAHARRRRLHTERLRRDRRRRRAGRAPILRSSAFEMLIPRAQVDVRKTGPEYEGMEVVLSPMVPEDQVYIVDGSMLRNRTFVEPRQLDVPKMFDLDRAAWKSQILYGSHLAPRPAHRATNFLIQADEHARRDLGLPSGVRPSRVWVDDVEVDVDTWMNEGGTE